ILQLGLRFIHVPGLDAHGYVAPVHPSCSRGFIHRPGIVDDGFGRGRQFPACVLSFRLIECGLSTDQRIVGLSIERVQLIWVGSDLFLTTDGEHYGYNRQNDGHAYVAMSHAPPCAESGITEWRWLTLITLCGGFVFPEKIL